MNAPIMFWIWIGTIFFACAVGLFAFLMEKRQRKQQQSEGSDQLDEAIQAALESLERSFEHRIMKRGVERVLTELEVERARLDRLEGRVQVLEETHKDG